MTKPVNWELRFLFGVLLGWLALTGLFARWHLPARARYEAGRAAATGVEGPTGGAAELCRRGIALGEAHPFEAGAAEVELLDLLRGLGVDAASVEEAADALSRGEPPRALATPERWPMGSPLPELLTLLEAVSARRAGSAIDEEAVGLFIRRPEWWRALLRSWPPAPPAQAPEAQLSADARVWAGLIERREAAVATGDVFLGFLLLGNMVLGLGLWLGSRAHRGRAETNIETTRSEG